jgi:phenylacetate-CoA ligase
LLPRFLWDGLSGSNFGRLPYDDLKRLQEKRLRRIVHLAYDKSKFWHARFDDAGVRPTDIRGVEDLRRMPICVKSELETHRLEDRVIGDPDALVPAPTSGTTGARLKGAWSKSYNDYFASIIYFRMRSLAGIDLFDQMTCLRFSTPRENGATRFPYSELSYARRRAALGVLEPLISRAGKGIYNRLYMTYGIEEILPEITRTDPAAYWGLTSLVRLLADAVSTGKAPNLHPKAVICGGDYFDEFTRSYLESTLRCPALCMYAANEVGFIGQECKEKVGMHIMADSMIVEVLKDGEPVAPGEIGELIVTPLLNLAMPMIRYNLGDVVRSTDEVCPCGRSTPMLKSVEGRTRDLLLLDENRSASTRDIASIINSDRVLAPCQLVQEGIDHFRLLFFASEEPSTIEAASILLVKLRRVLGDDALIDVSFEGPREDRRKIRITTSLLKPSMNNPRPG